MALAPDAAGLHGADDAALVGADRGEALELTLGGLGHHDLLLREDQAAADGDLVRVGERPGVGGVGRVPGVEAAVGGVGRGLVTPARGQQGGGEADGGGEGEGVAAVGP